MDILRNVILGLIPLVLSLSVHEAAHAWVAWLLGDDTAKRAGRLTLNPLAHIDFIGTLLLPGIGLATGGGLFGWAKPVPCDTAGFRRGIPPRLGMTLVAAAGPVSNLIFAVALAVVLGLVGFPQHGVPHDGATDEAIATFAGLTLSVNVMLALFNLVPLPPLDGSKILSGLLPRPLARPFDWLESRPFVSLMILVLLLGSIGRSLTEPIHEVRDGLIALAATIDRSL